MCFYCGRMNNPWGLTMRSKRNAIAVAVAVALGAWGTATASADEIYTYTGNLFSAATSPYSTSDEVTLSFTVATPLGDNLNDFFVTPTSFTAFDGIDTISNNGVVPNIQIYTDSNGKIIQWDIDIFTQVQPTPGLFIETKFYPFGDDDAVFTDYGKPLSDALASNSGVPGVWVQSVGVPGPIAGAGLPGLVFACVGYFVWWRRKWASSGTLAAA
jgi:hypothetical protein